MLRRIAGTAVARAAGARMFTPSEDLKKLYGENFESGTYPVNIVPSDSTVFAQFLFKAAEQKNLFDKVLEDFATISAASAKLPVFWERTEIPSKIAEFKNLQPATMFTLMWMKDNGMLEQLPAVRAAFTTYANALRKKAVAKIIVGDEKDAASVAEAKKIAAELQKANPSLSGFALSFEVTVDKAITGGFCVDLAGAFVNQAKGAQAAAAASNDDVDYTNVPAPKTLKTVWEDNIETEVLRKHLDRLALFDAEEAKNGV